MGDIPLAEKHPASVSLNQADNHIKGSGFSGSVGTKQADNLSPVDVEADLVHYPALFIGFYQVFRSK
jgi:hypothetical protein